MNYLSLSLSPRLSLSLLVPNGGALSLASLGGEAIHNLSRALPCFGRFYDIHGCIIRISICNLLCITVMCHNSYRLSHNLSPPLDISY